MIAIIPTDESLGAQMRVTAALEAAGLEGASVEPGTASELEDLEHLQWRIGQIEEADVEGCLENWEELAEHLLKLDELLPAKIEDKLRDLIADSKRARLALP